MTDSLAAVTKLLRDALSNPTGAFVVLFALTALVKDLKR